jgi:hypothetical protein
LLPYFSQISPVCSPFSIPACSENHGFSPGSDQPGRGFPLAIEPGDGKAPVFLFTQRDFPSGLLLPEEKALNIFLGGRRSFSFYAELFSTKFVLKLSTICG